MGGVATVDVGGHRVVDGSAPGAPCAHRALNRWKGRPRLAVVLLVRILRPGGHATDFVAGVLAGHVLWRGPFIPREPPRLLQRPPPPVIPVAVEDASANLLPAPVTSPPAPVAPSVVAAPVSCPPGTLDVPASQLTLLPFPHAVRPTWPRPRTPDQARSVLVPRFCIQRALYPVSSSAAPRLSHDEAEQLCHVWHAGASLPRVDQWEALQRAPDPVHRGQRLGETLRAARVSWEWAHDSFPAPIFNLTEGAPPGSFMYFQPGQALSGDRPRMLWYQHANARGGVTIDFRCAFEPGASAAPAASP